MCQRKRLVWQFTSVPGQPTDCDNREEALFLARFRQAVILLVLSRLRRYSYSNRTLSIIGSSSTSTASLSTSTSTSTKGSQDT